MSTHSIGFYEYLTKIIFELSSNINKYAPYFFCCTRFKRGLQMWVTNVGYMLFSHGGVTMKLEF